jgi:hypothetical protein
MQKQLKKVELAKEWQDKNCPVCMDHFTAIIRQPIQCAYCPHATCRQCCSRYLLTTMNDPHCMDCKREWNREFIDKNLTQTFRKGLLKQHRRKVLMDRERGRLPAMQIFVEARMEQSKVSAERTVLLDEWLKVRKQKKHIQAAHNLKEDTETVAQLQEKIRPLNLKQERLDKQIKDVDARMRKIHMILYGKEKPEARQFIMKCPSEGCRGFLSQAWKCGTCQKHFCSDCHAEKAGHKDEEHICNADAKATAQMIRNETRPCPKCGIRISKINGCFAKDTPILLWDCSVKMSQDICVGDILIGDDESPRTVKTLLQGEDRMFEISQDEGMTYTVNSKHTLVLMNEKEQVREMTVEEYLAFCPAEQSKWYGYLAKDDMFGKWRWTRYTKTKLTIRSVGKGAYYGWSVSGNNKRFLLSDFTVVRNCDQMWCTSCQTTWSWKSGQILLNTVVHNPHYYEYLRRQNNGVVPREAGDVPCGGLPQNWLFTRKVLDTHDVMLHAKTKILDIHRCLSDIQYYRLNQYPLRQQANVNQEHDIQYLMNNMTEEAWGTALERTETNFERRKEVGLILQTLLHIGSEKLSGFYNATNNERGKLVWGLIKEMEDIRNYTNSSLIARGILMGIVVPQIGDDWSWKHMSRAEMKKHGGKIIAEEETSTAVQADVSSNTVVLPNKLVGEMSNDKEGTIPVDIGGELIDMEIGQAREMFGILEGYI